MITERMSTDKPNVLLIADKEDAELLDANKESVQWNLHWYVQEYKRLAGKVAELQYLISKHRVDYVMYSRNDGVAGRISIGPITSALKIGYSSFSGIDPHWREAEMTQCFEDFVKCGRRLDFNLPVENAKNTTHSHGTFSVAFDTEQLGGVRYGLPRILTMLGKHGVKATFFVTNLMKVVYSDLLNQISRRGHEVGIHGMWHEYLTKYSVEQQTRLIHGMISDFNGNVSGANFMYRMDRGTLKALVTNRIRYLVHPMMNYHRFISYPKISTRPALLEVSGRQIWMLPISAETYGLPWLCIKNMLDSAISLGARTGFPHVSVLCHPFRDGSLSHIEATENMLRYLLSVGLAPVTLAELVKDHLHTADTAISRCPNDFHARKTRIAPPTTTQDFLGIVPENAVKFWRLIRRGRTPF